jgi:hypothetical protein
MVLDSGEFTDPDEAQDVAIITPQPADNEADDVQDTEPLANDCKKP